ncbi:MAG: hypothetical protein HY294_04690 [Candidatus Rokubacteria bacterium]|nr:hypothetical protein [Candidatus Rokubacteria bacterium]
MSASLTTGFLISFVASLLLTLGAERVARRAGVVARPAADRWHRETVPLMGGVAIVLATIVPTLAQAMGDRRLTVLAVTALAMATVGLVDDLRALSPQVKLLAQILLATVLIQFGFVLRLTGSGLVDVFVTLFWLVGITNAFNLLDNMDGLSATIALVATGFRLLFFHWSDDVLGAKVAATFMGALAGFLVRNFAPAKVFMGDAGSLFMGFFLAGLSLVDPLPYSRGVVAVLLVPVLVLLVPIFDTAFVTATRLLSGRSPARGGRDHTSHRLVAIGLTERQAVLLLAAVSAATGGAAVFSYRVGPAQAGLLLAALAIGLVLLGAYLGRVRVLEAPDPTASGAVLRLLADFPYKRQVLTLTLDVGLIAVAYYAAYVLRFEGAFTSVTTELYGSLPIVLVIQLATLGGFGLYRGVWQYTGVTDLVRIVKAATVGAMTSMVVLLYISRFQGYSRTVFVLDWILLIVMIGGSRVSFRLFAELFRREPESFQRVVIYGAGDGGALLVREIFNNPTLQRVAVGFIDDDRGKHRTRIHGLPVFGGAEQIEPLVREQGITEIIVSSRKIDGEALTRVRDTCAELQVAVRRASFQLE